MKPLEYAVAAMLAVASIAYASDHKHPDDKCPTGQHTVTKETTVSTGGDVHGDLNGGVASGGAKVEHGRSTVEKKTLCRDNKDSGVTELNSGTTQGSTKGSAGQTGTNGSTKGSAGQTGTNGSANGSAGRTGSNGSTSGLAGRTGTNGSTKGLASAGRSASGERVGGGERGGSGGGGGAGSGGGGGGRSGGREFSDRR